MFSVVIPVFNGRATLARAVESVLAQSLGEFELIVVDDGSVDGTLDSIAGQRDSRIRRLRQDNAGPGPARNAGTNAGRHATIAFLDADDVWLPDHLSELDRLRREFPEAGMIGTSYSCSASGGALPSVASSEGRRKLIDYIDSVGRGEKVLCASSAAVSRAAWIESGGFEPFPSGEDSELWVRLAIKWPVAASTRVTALYLRQPTGIIETRRRARFESPPASLDDLSPAVATLRRQAEAIPPERRRIIHRFVERYFHWHLREAVQATDLVTVRALARLAPARVQPADRLLLLLAKLPAPLARTIYAMAFGAKRPNLTGEPDRPSA